MASFDVIFIGAGPAGYVGAIRCAQLGLSVAVIEKDKAGGTCVAWGCIPAKALLAAGAVANQTRHAAEFGVVTGEVKFEFGVASKRAKGVSDQNVKGVEFLFKKNKITHINGSARLTGKSSVAVKLAGGKEEKHEAKKAVVIATGSRVRGLPQAGLELNGTTVISSDEALYMPKLAKNVAIVGAGAVGCEFADVFNAYGARVTLIEMMPNILPIEDVDVSSTLQRSFKKRGMEVLVGAKLASAKVGRDSVTLSVDVGGQKSEVKVEQVLVATGRAPVTDGAGLRRSSRRACCRDR
jgi:dihydrolipoamide dehydrogenase